MVSGEGWKDREQEYRRKEKSDRKSDGVAQEMNRHTESDCRIRVHRRCQADTPEDISSASFRFMMLLHATQQKFTADTWQNSKRIAEHIGIGIVGTDDDAEQRVCDVQPIAKAPEL